jgi:hypothetical protein
VTTIIGHLMDLANEVLILYMKSRADPNLTFLQLINGKKLWFLQKLLEFPINIYNCDVSSLGKGDAHFYSFFSLVIYMIRHY